MLIFELLEKKGVPHIESEAYKTFSRTYQSIFHKAIKREKLRKLQAKTRSENWKVERLSNSVKAIKCLEKVIDIPRVREKLLYKIDPIFLAGNVHVKRDMPCLFIYNYSARKILRKHLCNPVKMIKKTTLKALAEQLIQAV